MSNQLVTQYEGMLYDIANGISRERADDLVQEAWSRILTQVDRFDEALAGESTWLCILARAAMLDFVRGEAREPSMSPADEVFPIVALDEADPYTVVANEEFINDLLDWLDRQPEEKKQIIEARLVDGYAFPIIGAMFGKSADTVRKMCNRAEEELRAIRERV